MTALNLSPIGKKQEIKWIVGNSEDVSFIRKLGITEGALITVLSSFHGNVIVALDNFRYAVDLRAASCIKVE